MKILGTCGTLAGDLGWWPCNKRCFPMKYQLPRDLSRSQSSSWHDVTLCCHRWRRQDSWACRDYVSEHSKLKRPVKPWHFWVASGSRTSRKIPVSSNEKVVYITVNISSCWNFKNAYPLFKWHDFFLFRQNRRRGAFCGKLAGFLNSCEILVQLGDIQHALHVPFSDEIR